MKHLFSLFLLFAFGFSQAQTVNSPSGKIALTFTLSSTGQPTYLVNYKAKTVVATSDLGIKLKDKPALDANFEIQSSKNSTFNESWKPVLGEQSSIVSHYNELVVSLVQKSTNVKVNLVFRAFDEGVAFRYDFPKQKELNYFIISDENTQFNVTENNKVFWLPGDFDSNEYEYNETQLSEIDNSKINMNNGIGVKSIPGKYTIQTPLMMKSPSGLYVNIFEAAVINYPVMHLKADVTNYKLKSELVPNAIGDKAYLQTPCVSPWRTIMISDDARDIVGSKMILNLNEPSKIEDTSWIKPMKYVGIWWEMHVGKSTWDYAGSQNAQNTESRELIASGKHGATTENTKRYIDFAAKHGFDGVLVEGWNVGWEDWFGHFKDYVFDFVTPYPDFDVKGIKDYAKSKNIKMIMHHETSGSIRNYERHIDTAYKFMKANGYDAVKSGYVGSIVPVGQNHYNQHVINHYQYAIEKAADYKIMVNAHEAIRPTGIARTYPNLIGNESARGTEYQAFGGSKPNHVTLLPFTRLLGGPMDYTPGIFEMDISKLNPNNNSHVNSTIANQLALYLTMYSPLQMAADLPENYMRFADAFQFIKDVAVDWDDSKYLEAEPGEYITVARKAKNTNNWFLGSVGGNNTRTSNINFNFLDADKTYIATIYADAKDAHYKTNPQAYTINKFVVNSKSKLSQFVAAGGGYAISFIPADKTTIKGLKKLK